MTRYYGKPDTSQADIVAALRKVRAQVTITSAVGRGFPDLVVSHAGAWYVMEVKTGSAKLNAYEALWHMEARAPVHVVRNAAEALQVLFPQPKKETDR